MLAQIRVVIYDSLVSCWKDAMREQEEQVIYWILSCIFWRWAKQGRKMQPWCWLQEVSWYGPIKFDSRLFKNIWDIYQSLEIHQGIPRKWESGINHWRNNFSYGKNPKRYLPERCLLPLPFVRAMMPLNHVLRKCNGGYKYTNHMKRLTT